MATEDTLIFRKATHADCDAIKGIDREFHPGFDRLLCKFHQDIVSEHKFPYVAEVKGQIIAYECGHVIDDGEAIVMREVRIRHDFRGRSLVTKLHVNILQKAMFKFPNLQTMLWSSDDIAETKNSVAKHPGMKITFRSSGQTLSLHSRQLQAIITSGNFKELAESYQISQIQSHSKPDSLKILTEEIKFLDFAPARPMIGWQPSGWHVSTLAEQILFTDIFISRDPENSNKIEAFSFFQTAGCDAGPRVDLGIFCDGNRGNAEYLVYSHILNALKHMAMFFHGTLFLKLHFPILVDRSVVKGLLQGNLGIKLDDNDWIQHQLQIGVQVDETINKNKL